MNARHPDARSLVDSAIEASGGTQAWLHRLWPDANDDAPLVRKLDYVMADALPTDDRQFDDELIEGILSHYAMAVLYGDANAGKTFAAIDIGAAICRGVPWMNRGTVGGLVIYLASEAPASVEMRLMAYQKFHRVQLAGFVVVRTPISLFDGQADVSAVIALVAAIESEHGAKVSLVIGDTLARISAGANENAGQDMSIVMKRADAIREATGAAFLWLHHCGKDQARGMRGWSGIRAAIDTEIEITADEASGLRSIEVTKQRDLSGKGERIGFRLEPVRLGVNRWNNPRSSCVIVPAESPTRQTRGRRPSEIAGAIAEFLTAHGAGCLRGALAKHFDGRYLPSSVYREVRKMIDDGSLIESAGVVALPGRPAKPVRE